MSLADWVAEGDLAREGRIRLFCFPHAGSGTAGFHRWKRLLPSWIAVCPVMLPGRERRMLEAPLESSREIVAALLDAVRDRLPERPYALFGHSMGALLAYEFACAIQEKGLPPPVRLFCSGRGGPQQEAGSLSGLGDEEFLDGLALQYGSDARSLMDDAEMRALFLPVLRADLRVVESFRMPANGRLGCGISAFAGVDDQSVPEAGLLRWQDVSGPGFRTARLPGGHLYSFGVGQEELLAALTQELRGTEWEEAGPPPCEG